MGISLEMLFSFAVSRSNWNFCEAEETGVPGETPCSTCGFCRCPPLLPVLWLQLETPSSGQDARNVDCSLIMDK